MSLACARAWISVAIATSARALGFVSVFAHFLANIQIIQRNYYFSLGVATRDTWPIEEEERMEGAERRGCGWEGNGRNEKVVGVGERSGREEKGKGTG